jgi:hypothetical protein
MTVRVNQNGTFRDDTVKTTDQALVVGIRADITQGSIPVTVSTAGSGTTATVTRVAATASSTTLLASNTSRRSAGFCNNATSANLYLKLGATASISAGSESFTVKIPAGGFFRLYLNEYSGIVDGIWDSAESGAECLITEVT